MPVRLRKLIGTIGLLTLVMVWSLLAMGTAQFVLPSTNSLLAWIYYAVAGMGWVLPAMPLVRWMSQPAPRDRASTPP